jgi:hypothetical protein
MRFFATIVGSYLLHDNGIAKDSYTDQEESIRMVSNGMPCGSYRSSKESCRSFCQTRNGRPENMSMAVPYQSRGDPTNAALSRPITAETHLLVEFAQPLWV